MTMPNPNAFSQAKH